MSLSLGKSFDRNYNIRVPFLSGNYNIGTYLNKKSSFLLFSVEPDHIFNHKCYETEENPKYIWCQTCFDLVKIWS
ncbi:hypothetical protein LCGC14_2073550 [marine sediment metagenome]|uniref:Uncharacterized protein n=1 Tax=marine sediment metagenome TaxID=412755 RepID=A0A0F9F4Z9_9ZZZZ